MRPRDQPKRGLACRRSSPAFLDTTRSVDEEVGMVITPWLSLLEHGWPGLRKKASAQLLELLSQRPWRLSAGDDLRIYRVAARSGVPECATLLDHALRRFLPVRSYSGGFGSNASNVDRQRMLNMLASGYSRLGQLGMTSALRIIAETHYEGGTYMGVETAQALTLLDTIDPRWRSSSACRDAIPDLARAVSCIAARPKDRIQQLAWDVHNNQVRVILRILVECDVTVVSTLAIQLLTHEIDGLVGNRHIHGVDMSVLWDAARALGELGGPTVVEPLLAFVQKLISTDPRWGVINSVVKDLIKTGDARVVRLTSLFDIDKVACFLSAENLAALRGLR